MSSQFRTPSPPANATQPNPSSPIKKTPSYFAEHKRDQFQAFGYDPEIHELKSLGTNEAFLDFLDVPQKIRDVTPPRSLDVEFTFENFGEQINVLSKSLKAAREFGLFSHSFSFSTETFMSRLFTSEPFVVQRNRNKSSSGTCH